MTTEILNYTGNNCKCCCSCVLDLDYEVRGMGFGAPGCSSSSDYVTASTDCRGFTPNKTRNGYYKPGQLVSISAVSGITCNVSCGDQTLDFYRWEIEWPDGSVTYEYNENTAIVMPDADANNCGVSATAIFEPRYAAIAVGGSTEFCFICSGNGKWQVAVGVGGIGSISPQPDHNGHYALPCRGGPNSITVTYSPVIQAQQCGGGGIIRDAAFCEANWLKSGSGISCSPSSGCTSSPSVVISLTCFNTCTGLCIVQVSPEYAVTDLTSCGDCGFGC